MIAELLPSSVWTRPPRAWVVAAATSCSKNSKVGHFLRLRCFDLSRCLRTSRWKPCTTFSRPNRSWTRWVWSVLGGCVNFGFISINFPVRVPHSWPRTRRWCRCLTGRWSHISGTVQAPACPGDRPSTRVSICGSTVSSLPRHWYKLTWTLHFCCFTCRN